MSEERLRRVESLLLQIVGDIGEIKQAMPLFADVIGKSHSSINNGQTEIQKEQINSAINQVRILSIQTNIIKGQTDIQNVLIEILSSQLDMKNVLIEILSNQLDIVRKLNRRR